MLAKQFSYQCIGRDLSINSIHLNFNEIKRFKWDKIKLEIIENLEVGKEFLTKYVIVKRIK